jgi:hypothetical protein
MPVSDKAILYPANRAGKFRVNKQQFAILRRKNSKAKLFYQVPKGKNKNFQEKKKKEKK